MAELKDKIYDILKQPQLATLATITEDGRPWVRYVFAIANAELVVRCATFAKARKVQQIRANPEVHMTCGVTTLDDRIPYLQIQARAALATEQEEKQALWNPGLEKIFEGPDDPNYAVLIITPYRIEYCVPGQPQPDVWEA